MLLYRAYAAAIFFPVPSLHMEYYGTPEEGGRDPRAH